MTAAALPNMYRAKHWAQSQRLGNVALRFTLLTLAGYADQYGRLWPSQEALADETEQSVRTVRDQLKRLEGLGLISRTRRNTASGHRTSDLIQLNYDVVLDLRHPWEIPDAVVADSSDPVAEPLPAESAGRGGPTGKYGPPTGRLLPVQGRTKEEEPSEGSVRTDLSPVHSPVENLSSSSAATPGPADAEPVCARHPDGDPGYRCGGCAEVTAWRQEQALREARERDRRRQDEAKQNRNREVRDALDPEEQARRAQEAKAELRAKLEAQARAAPAKEDAPDLPPFDPAADHAAREAWKAAVADAQAAAAEAELEGVVT